MRKIDYREKLVELASMHQPPGANGWDLLVQAAEMIDPIIDEVNALDFERHPSRADPYMEYVNFDGALEGELDPLVHAPEMMVLERLEASGALELLEQACACPRAVRSMEPSEQPLYMTLRPELSYFRQLVRARTLSMRKAAFERNAVKQVSALRHTLRICSASAGQPFLIDRYVAIACLRVVLEELNHELLEYGVDEETGHALMKLLETETKWPPASVCLEAERLGVLDLIQSLYSDDGHGNGRVDVGQLENILMLGGPPVSSAPPDRRSGRCSACRSRGDHPDRQRVLR